MHLKTLLETPKTWQHRSGQYVRQRTDAVWRLAL